MPKDTVYNKIHQEPTGQVALYQAGNRYDDLLTQRYGARFLDYRQKWAQSSRREISGDFPLNIDLAINSGCQLSCIMCPLPGRPDHRRRQLMPPSVFREIMAEAKEHKLPAATFGLAGEPLLHPQAAELVAIAVDSDIMDIRFGTNGLLLTDDIMQKFIGVGLSRLEISVDAVKESTYAAVRPGGNLGKLERIIDRFLNLRAKAGSPWPLLRLSFIKLDLNRDELDDFLKKWSGQADLVSIQDHIWFKGSALPEPQGPLVSQGPVCAQSWQRLSVNYDGKVWPCCSWLGEDLLPFSLPGKTLADIWVSEEMAGLRQKLAGPANSLPQPCRQCRL